MKFIINTTTQASELEDNVVSNGEVMNDTMAKVQNTQASSGQRESNM